MTELEGIENATVEAKIAFLRSRGDVHASFEGDGLAALSNNDLPMGWDIARLHRIAAAKCFRDAAVLALALDDAATARQMFGRAGSIAAALGDLIGFLFLELSRQEGDDPWWKIRTSDFSRVRDRVAGSRGRRTPEAELETAEPFWPERLLPLYQSLLLNLDDETIELSVRVRAMLDEWQDYILDRSEIPLKTYLAALDRASSKAPSLQDTVSRTEAVDSILLRRQEFLSAARSNRYHWANLTLPVDLVDLNLLFLGALALDNGTWEEIVPRQRGTLDAMTSLSLDRASLIARGKRRDIFF